MVSYYIRFLPIFTLGALTLTLIGAGCTKSLEARVSQYEDERKVCIEERRSASPAITFNGLTRPWDEGVILQRSTDVQPLILLKNITNKIPRESLNFV